ncbi:hypothetical protein H2248_012570 [Termitomyces sp. 'cryptogamus']|nr:hypothetical protein H2248_012570 [Termitomyces sp. 'cryptogamus']
MPAHQRNSVILPFQENSIEISGTGPVRGESFISTTQSPSHERTISTLDNTIMIMDNLGTVVSLPVVKGVLVSVSGILNIIKTTIKNQDDFQELAEQCQMIGLVVWHATSAIPQHQLDSTILRALTNLKSSVDGILMAVKAKTEQNTGSKAFHATINQNTIIKWKNDLIYFLALFNVSCVLNTDSHYSKFSSRK